MPYDIDDLSLRNEALMRRYASLVVPPIARWHRAEVTGLERIPQGPALYVGNHSGALLSIDTFIWGARVCLDLGVEHVPYGLAHELALNLPLVNQLLVPLGGVRASHENAAALFEAGKKLLVYPGGDVDTLRPWRERDTIKFDGRAGFIKLAMRHRIPIIPVVTQGAHSTMMILHDFPQLARALHLNERIRLSRWPLMLTFPWGITFGPSPPYIPFPTKIRTEFLEPVWLDFEQADPGYPQDASRRLRWKMESALRQLALKSSPRTP